jgi:hypothetical protein
VRLYVDTAWAILMMQVGAGWVAACAADSYKVVTGNSTCLSCPANSGTVGATNSIARGQCVCNLGYTGDLSGTGNCTSTLWPNARWA